jgi:hypothetical protein
MNSDGFMGYYVGQSSYEILSITENRMAVRFVQANNTGLAWYDFYHNKTNASGRLYTSFRMSLY